MVVARWDDRMGVTPEAAFPEAVADLLEHDDLLTIFSTHAITEKPGILAMRIKRLNIVSYYSGLPEGEKTEQFFVVVILDQDEEPNTYEERLTEIAKLIISSVGKPGFSEIFGQFYDQLIKMEKITEEQRYAFIFRDDIRRLLLQKLTNGPMTKEGLAKWISKEIDEEVTDIDSLLQPLKRTELIEEVNIAKGKKVSLEYVFLMRDVAVIRIPNIEIFKIAKSDQMAEDIRDKYVEEVEKYFKEYRISNQDSGVLGECISDPDSYEVIMALRNEYCTRAELPMKLARDIPRLEKILRDLADNRIITAVKDKKERIWVFLLSDIKFPTFFPEYMIDIIRRRWKEGTIAKEIALKHLELLRAEYIATQAPKYRKKMLKTIMDYFVNAENMIKKNQLDQAATVLDTMAGLSRDMGERQLGELLDNAGKLLREDKEKYLEEQFPDDRAAILEHFERITEHDTKKKKVTEVEMEKDKKGVSKRAEQVETKAKKKKKSSETYVEPETIEEESDEGAPEFDLNAPIGDMKLNNASDDEIDDAYESSSMDDISIDSDLEDNVSSDVDIPKNNNLGIFSPPPIDNGSTDSTDNSEQPTSKNDLKAQRKEIQNLIKQANKNKNLEEVAKLMGELADIEESLGNDKAANNLRQGQEEVAIKALIQFRIQWEKDAKSAEKKGNYAKAAELYGNCKNVSNQLFKSGIAAEANNAKKFAKLEAEISAKAEGK